MGIAVVGACGPPPAADPPLPEPVPAVDSVVAPEPPFLFPRSTGFRLDNGLEVELLVVAGDRVAIALGIRAGSVTEPPGLPGLARFTAAVAPEGTRRHTGEELRRRWVEAGATLDVRIDRDGVVLEVDVAPEEVEPALEVLSEIVREAVFPESAVERFRAQEQAAVAVAGSDPAWPARRAWLREVYGEHPYAREDAGEEGPAMLRPEHLATFHHDWWAADGAFLVVAGPIAIEELRPMVRTTFTRWRDGAPPPLPVADPAPSGPRRILLIDRPDADRFVVMVGGAGAGMRDPRQPALALAVALLGGGDEARLLRNRALRAAGVFTAGAWLEEAEQGGPAFVFVEASSASVETVLDELLAELRRLRPDRPDRTRLGEGDPAPEPPGSGGGCRGGSPAGGAGPLLGGRRSRVLGRGGAPPGRRDARRRTGGSRGVPLRRVGGTRGGRARRDDAGTVPAPGFGVRDRCGRRARAGLAQTIGAQAPTGPRR